MNQPTLADVVRAARKQKGLSQVEVAERVGMSQRWVSDIERGATESPHLPTLRRLADVLDLDIADLIIAGGMANSRSGAYRIAESVPLYGSDDDAPLTPDEEAIFINLVFRGYAEMTNAQKRMIINATKQALNEGS